MTTKYAIKNPNTQEYEQYEDRAVAMQKFCEYAIDTYINHYNHGSPWTMVNVLEDGSEQWFAPTGEQILSPDEQRALALEAVANLPKGFMVSGEVPMTTLGE